MDTKRIAELREWLKKRRAEFKGMCLGMAVKEEWVLEDRFFRDILLLLDEYEKTRAGATVYKVRTGVMAFAAILESMLRDHEGAISQPEGTDDAGWLLERLRDEALKLVEYATKGMLSEDTPSPGLSDADEQMLSWLEHAVTFDCGSPDWPETEKNRDRIRALILSPAARAKIKLEGV